MAFDVSPERIARQCARRPWTVIGLWVVPLVLAVVSMATLLDSALTTRFVFINTPESQRGVDLMEKLRGFPISTNEVVKPYLSASPSKTDFPYVEPEKYQIVCAGQDGKFGAAGGLYPDGVGYSEADEDNLTSFSDGKTLEDAIP